MRSQGVRCIQRIVGAGSTNSSPEPQDLIPLCVYSRFTSCSPGPVCVWLEGIRASAFPAHTPLSLRVLNPVCCLLVPGKAPTKGRQGNPSPVSRRRDGIRVGISGAVPAPPLPAGGAADPRPCPSGAGEFPGTIPGRGCALRAAPAQPEPVPRPRQTGLTAPAALPWRPGPAPRNP